VNGASRETPSVGQLTPRTGPRVGKNSPGFSGSAWPILVRLSPSGTEFIRPESDNVAFKKKFPPLAAMLDLV